MEPPENVRLLFDDGTELPVETYYAGIEAGLHVWVCTYAIPTSRVGKITGIRATRIPPHTALRLEGVGP